MIAAAVQTFLWACVPLLELRASIPLGHLRYGLSLWEASIISISGIMLTSALLLFILPKVVDFFEKHSPFFDKILKKIFEKTRGKHSHKMSVIGEIALILFVALPVPGSGAWSGVLIAYLFNVPYKKALFLLFIGVSISAFLIAVITLFGKNIWDLFFPGVLL